MSHQHAKSEASTTRSIHTILSCTSDNFQEYYWNQSLSTDVLLGKTKLDDLLVAMIEHAPHELGKRYVAVVLHVACNAEKRDPGSNVVIDVANAWRDHLLLPILAVSTDASQETVPSSSQTPSSDETVRNIERATRQDQMSLRKRLLERERYRCAITGAMDRGYALGHRDEFANGRAPYLAKLQAARIIPFSLDHFRDEDNKDLKESVYTWDMLKNWTQYDIEKLAGSKINSPANAILMSSMEHELFGRFKFYLEAHSDMLHRYVARFVQDRELFSNVQATANVTFQSTPDAEPPDSTLIEVHAAFAKILHACGAAEHFDDIEREQERDMDADRLESDFTSLLTAKLVATVLAP